MARSQRVDSFEHQGYLICQLKKNCIVFEGSPLPTKCWWFSNAFRAKTAIEKKYLEKKNNERK